MIYEHLSMNTRVPINLNAPWHSKFPAEEPMIINNDQTVAFHARHTIYRRGLPWFAQGKACTAQMYALNASTHTWNHEINIAPHIEV